tara:strand:+ start:85 stop:342 length:258 start_codon:yes stop_codon:yes gene_type:complete
VPKNKMDIIIHTIDGCIKCDHMKELCDRAGVEYKTSATPYLELAEMYPNFKTTGYPYIIIDGKEIGDCLSAAKFFLKEGLVSVPK